MSESALSLSFGEAETSHAILPAQVRACIVVQLLSLSVTYDLEQNSGVFSTHSISGRSHYVFCRPMTRRINAACIEVPTLILSPFPLEAVYDVVTGGCMEQY